MLLLLLLLQTSAAAAATLATTKNSPEKRSFIFAALSRAADAAAEGADAHYSNDHVAHPGAN